MTVIYLPRRRRGRPVIPREEKDLGTPELREKRAHQVTAEALDLCLEKGLITPEQHWSGIHLRWLYTLRFGAPGVRAVDPNHIIGLDMECDDPSWREAREAEYHAALKYVGSKKLTSLLMSICIYNERPDFLSARMKKKTIIGCDLVNLRDGLSLLATHWGRIKKRH